jgi:hypothetical protein
MYKQLSEDTVFEEYNITMYAALSLTVTTNKPVQKVNFFLPKQ